MLPTAVVLSQLTVLLIRLGGLAAVAGTMYIQDQLAKRKAAKEAVITGVTK